LGYCCKRSKIENVTELNKSPTQGVYELRRGRTLVKNIIPETTREKVNGIFNALKRTFKFVKTHLNVRLNALFQLK
jgi:hypothetical protein